MRSGGGYHKSTKVIVKLLSYASFVLCIAHQSKGFGTKSAFKISRKSCEAQNSSMQRSSSLLLSKDSTTQNDNKKRNSAKEGKDIIILSFDGVVADTSSWRSNLAIDAAYSTWPNELNSSDLDDYNLDVDNADRLWVVNKLNALMQVMLSDQNGMTNCDAVLLTRLLLEEQLLDGGRSVGKRGKYASQFHPSTASSNKHGSSSDRNSGSSQGSRPLTVGEIAVNWVDGACLRDTVRVKYNVDGKDPIPIIEQNICEVLAKHDKAQYSPQVYPQIANELNVCDCPVYILVGHESHLKMAVAALKQVNISTDVLSLEEVTEGLKEVSYESEKVTKDSDGVGKKVILVAPAKDGRRGHIGLLQQMIMSSEKGTSMHFIHAILNTLRDAKMLFGDNRPPLNGYGKCGIGNEITLKLSLPTWANCAGFQEQNDALMLAPWLNTCDKIDSPEESMLVH